MKRIFLNKLFLSFSLALLSIYGIIYACAGGDDWDFFGYNSNFTPETFADKSYSPLFLSGAIFYGIGFDTQHNSRFNENIKSDWADYLKGKADTTTVNYFLIGDIAARYYDDKNAIKNKEEITDLHVYYKTKKENKSSQKWGKKINLKDEKIKNFVEFLYLAQKIETVSIREDFWSYEPVAVKTFNDAKMIQSIENVYNTLSDPFLKNRYWFLTMKARFYSNDKQKAIDFFNKTESSVAKNTLYYRALAYVAGINFKQHKYAVSNYLYAQVFDKCPELRVVTAYSFQPKNESDWTKALAMAKNNKEKAALWAIHGYYKDEKQAIEKIYELDPKSEHLNYLATRLVNSLEQKINNSFQQESSGENQKPKPQTVAQNKVENKSKIDNSAFDLVAKISAAGNTERPYLWDLSLGYLQTLKGDYANADKSFDKAAKILPKTELAGFQLRLLRFVNNLSKIDKLTDKNEKTIIADLNWLYTELPKTYKGQEFRYQNASSWSRVYLSSLYKEKGNLVMTEIFGESRYSYWNDGNAFYDNEKNLLDIKSFLGKQNKSDLEKIGAGIYSIKLKDINNFQAVQATFKNKIPEAIEFMKQADSVQYYKFLGNPFNGNIKDCHDCEHAAYQKRKYTFMDFLTTIKEMQDKVAQKEDVYTNSLLLGNAFYNISHFGNGRTFYEINIVGFGSSPYSFRNAMKNMITDNSLSKMYYQKAFEAASNKEQKAKCLYLISKCERNDYYNKKYNGINSYWEIQDDKVNFIAWNSFKALRKEYSDTKYYQDVIAECGYFNTYVNQ